MSKFVLDGYRPIAYKWPVYTLNVETGTIDVEWFDNQKKGQQLGPQVGKGDFRKVGTWGKRKKVFVAEYVDGDSLYLWLDGQRFDLINGDAPIVVKRDVDWLLRWRFRVFADGVVVFDCRYLVLDNAEFPNTDIFLWMAENSSSIEGRLRLFYILQDDARGKRHVTDEYWDSVAVRVRSAMKQRANPNTRI